MSGGGEIAAAFRALAEDAAQAGESIGKSMGRWMEDTADIEEENVNRTLAADAENARALSAIRSNAGHLPEGGAGAGAAGGESGNISRTLSGAGGPEAGTAFGGKTAGRRSLPPAVKKKLEEGREFNRENWPRYPHNEVDLASRKRVDSYRPNREIVERKFTQLANIKPETAKGYIDSMRYKYKPGQLIGDTPKNQGEGIAGDELKGRHILEVPPQVQPVPPDIIKYAAQHTVIIRDTGGKVCR